MNGDAYVIKNDSVSLFGPYRVVSAPNNGWVMLANGERILNVRTTEIIYGKKAALEAMLRVLKYRKWQIKKSIREIKAQLND